MKLTQVDITWNYDDAAIWSAVESNIAVISACLLVLRPMVRLVKGTFGSIGSLGKNCGHIAGIAGTGSNENPHSRSSTVLTTKHGGSGEECKLWEGRRSKDVQRMNLVGRSDTDMLGQAELGAVPRGAIHVHDLYEK